MRKLFTALALLILSNASFAQKEYYKWYFGNQAAMDFVPGAPVNITGNAMTDTDNPAIVSDSLGNVLFYTNGLQVWNKNNTVMPNGNGLLGNLSGGYTATIVRQPGTSNLYYLFTMDAFASSNGLRYNLIDMNLNGGLGDIVAGQKNIVLLNPASEQIVPVVAANGIDIWIIAHPWNSSSFNAYPITCTGLSTSPVVSTVGSFRGGANTDNATGGITVNSANNRIAWALYTDNNVELFDFDNSTGTLSNPIQLTGLSKAWGIEFSPNGSKLYASGWTTQWVSQFDLSTYTQPAIQASQVSLGNVTGPGAPYFTSYMQLAPDGKIYIAVYLDPFLGVINNPDAAGLACNLVDDGYNLGGPTSSAGLPDKIVVTHQTLTLNIGADTSYCGNFSRTLSTGNSHTVWSTGFNGAQITVTAGGTYSATVTNSCGLAVSDTIVITQNPAPVVNLGNDTTLCTGQTLLLDATNAGNTYLWQDNSTAAMFNVTAAGTYAVTATDPLGCAVSDNITVAYTSGPPVINIGNDTTYCGNFSRTLSTGDANTVWSTGVTAAQITVNSAGTYTATLSNGCGTASDNIVIGQNPTPVVTLGNDTALCTGQTLLLEATTAGATTYHWQDNSTNATFNVTAAGTYTVTVTNATGCAAIGSIVVSYNTQAPVVNLGPDIEICGNEGTVLHAGIANANYVWSDNSTDSVLTVSTTGTYTVTVSTGCGSATDAINIQIHADECALLIPTAFSPNNDGSNDKFRAISRCPVKRFELHLYNRWGEQVFETTDPTEGWDGIFRDNAQPMGVYVYYVEYFNYCEQKMKKLVGNITLVR